MNVTLSGDNRTEFESGDVVGYFHPGDVRYQIQDLRTTGYVLYGFITNETSSVNLNDAQTVNRRQPMIQFTIGE